MDDAISEIRTLLRRTTMAVEAILRDAESSSGKVSEPQKAPTAFPWHRVSKRCRENLRRMIECPGYRPFYSPAPNEPYVWPLSVEDLLWLAKDDCRMAKNVGDVCVSEIDRELTRLGFDWGR